MVPFGEAIVLVVLGVASIIVERPIVPATKKAVQVFYFFVIARVRRKSKRHRVVSTEPSATLRRPTRPHVPLPHIKEQRQRHHG